MWSEDARGGGEGGGGRGLRADAGEGEDEKPTDLRKTLDQAT